MTFIDQYQVISLEGIYGDGLFTGSPVDTPPGPDDELTFDPRNTATVVQGVWQKWDAIGGWWRSNRR